ncbi:hypothetical protein PHYBOEH_003869 [Phytophthora boehmeriae]|uniref:Uncharacterized protein n=1 Tax=Phytophthora boehmeriae TaxID=109152 RepID=A0A8T1X9I0_9STRA|nr:hypothetical protein PHYBOEH_003869 [Phytophthora boehmeriae]
MTFATTSSDRADLWICARSSEKTPILTRLLQEEAPPDDRNDLGETALHVAATCGNDEAAELLLRHGADLLAADWESGWTPLHRSFYRQHLSTSLLLLRHAQTRYGRQFLRKYLYETRDHDGKSPMDLLSSRRHSRLVTSDRLSDIATNTTSGGLVYTFGKRDYQSNWRFLIGTLVSCYGALIMAALLAKLGNLATAPIVLAA